MATIPRTDAVISNYDFHTEVPAIEPYIPSISDTPFPGSILTVIDGELRWVKQTSLVPAAVINETSNTATERQATVAAVGEVLPLVYGEQRLGAKIALVHDYQSNIYVIAAWALGENEEIVSIYINNDEDIKGLDYEVASYTGSLSQVADTTLVSILPGYSDDLIINKNGQDIPTCYSVLRFPSESFPSSIQAVIKGLKVYDPTLGYNAYSTNPALCLNDFLTNSIYGYGKVVLESSVLDCKDFNNTILSDGNVQRSINLAITSMAKLENHIELLRVYAGCFIVDHEEGLKLVPDTVSGTITRSFTEDDFIKNSVTVTRDKKADVPTVVTVKWTNTQVSPWRDDPATAKLDGTEDGSIEWRESVVQLQGINNYSQAYREAIERLNRLNFSDLTLEADTFDESLQDQIGDIAYFTHRIGLENKPMKIIECSLKSLGRWHIVAKEHSDANYSNEIQTEPSEPDTALPSPQNPYPPTNLILTEDVYDIGTGETVSRIYLQWTAPTFGFVEHYRIKIYAIVASGTQLVYEATTTSTNIYTDVMINEGMYHEVNIFTYSGIAYSEPLTNGIILNGSATTPDTVQSFSGIEAGGKVFLSWNDENSMPIRNYLIRYGDSSSTWDSGSIDLVKIDALAYIAQGIPAGDYKFHIKANSYYNELSPSAATILIAITIDSDYLAETIHGIMDEEESTNMVRFYKSRHNTLKSYVQSDGTDVFSSVYSSTLSAYYNVNGMFSYFDQLSYQWKTENMDFGAQLTGVWTGSIQRNDFGTGSQDSLLLSTDGVNFDSYVDMTEERTARYAKLQVYDSSGKLALTNEGSQVSVNVLSIKENGSVISNSSGAKTIGLNNFYKKVINITITPKITDGVTATADNIFVSETETNHFDIYVFNANNELISVECFWRFEGV